MWMSQALRDLLLFAGNTLEKEVKEALFVRFQADLRVRRARAWFGKSFFINIDVHWAGRAQIWVKGISHRDRVKQCWFLGVQLSSCHPLAIKESQLIG